MKLPSLTKSSSLGSGPDLGLARKGESIEARPMHQLERRIAPKVLGGSIKQSHGSHIKGLSMKAPSMGGMPSISSVKGY